MRRVALGTLSGLLLAAAPTGADTLQTGAVRLVPVGTFNQPIQALGAPGDDSRLFVVEKPGTIRVVRDGASSTFLTVPDVKAPTSTEQGLLSMAFAPDYATSGRFYVYFNDASACDGTGANCDVRIDEFRRASPDAADPGSRRMVLRIAHRLAANHNGGQIAFGPDGLLYAAPGDGGGAGDTDCDAQRGDSLLGKLLRVDATAGTAPQIYALGLRNPFRFSFDRLTGDLVLGDVGQGAQEEIDFLPAGTAPGVNFGWNLYEGTAAHPSTCLSAPPDRYVGPVLTYPNPAGGPAAVTGGVVVRDTSVAPLLGRYLYGDFYAGDVRSAVVGAGGASGDGSTGLLVTSLVAFGEDASCRVYVTSLAGPVYRLEATQPAGAPACQTSASQGPGAGAGGTVGTGSPPPAGTPLPDRVAPTVSRAVLSRRRFAVARARTPVVARRGPGLGTTVRFSLSEVATVTVRLYRRLPGRRSRGRCVAPSLRLRRAPRCTRFGRRGALTRRGLALGRRSIRFTGRVGRRALVPGAYRLTLRARDGAGNVSAGRALGFTVVPRR